MITIPQLYREHEEMLHEENTPSYELYELYEYVTSLPHVPADKLDKYVASIFYTLEDKDVVVNFLQVDFINDMFEMAYMLEAIQQDSEALQLLHTELGRYVEFDVEEYLYVSVTSTTEKQLN